MATTAELTEKYLTEHPSVKDCLKKGVINYSKLSREISKELSLDKKTSIEAILVACRRYAAKLRDDRVHENKVLGVLKKSELEIRNKIIVAVIDKIVYMEHLLQIEKKIRKIADTFYAVEGTKVFTLIFSEKHLDDVSELFGRNVIKMTKNLVMIIIKSPQDLESVHGVMSYLYSLFGEHGINIIETMSCWTDTIFVVSDRDVPKIMEFMKF
jgi:hypothetical protein